MGIIKTSKKVDIGTVSSRVLGETNVTLVTPEQRKFLEEKWAREVEVVDLIIIPNTDLASFVKGRKHINLNYIPFELSITLTKELNEYINKTDIFKKSKGKYTDFVDAFDKLYKSRQDSLKGQLVEKIDEALDIAEEIAVKFEKNLKAGEVIERQDSRGVAIPQSMDDLRDEVVQVVGNTINSIINDLCTSISESFHTELGFMIDLEAFKSKTRISVFKGMVSFVLAVGALVTMPFAGPANVVALIGVVKIIDDMCKEIRNYNLEAEEVRKKLLLKLEFLKDFYVKPSSGDEVFQTSKLGDTVGVASVAADSIFPFIGRFLPTIGEVQDLLEAFDFQINKMREKAWLMSPGLNKATVHLGDLKNKIKEFELVYVATEIGPERSGELNFKKLVAELNKMKKQRNKAEKDANSMLGEIDELFKETKTLKESHGNIEKLVNGIEKMKSDTAKVAEFIASSAGDALQGAFGNLTVSVTALTSVNNLFTWGGDLYAGYLKLEESKELVEGLL